VATYNKECKRIGKKNKNYRRVWGRRKTRRSGRRGKAISQGWMTLWVRYFNASMEWNPAVEAAPVSARTEHTSSLEVTSFICNLRTRLCIVLGDLLNNVLILSL
jgi:hypothetical protein